MMDDTNVIMSVPSIILTLIVLSFIMKHRSRSTERHSWYQDRLRVSMGHYMFDQMADWPILTISRKSYKTQFKVKCMI
jgi:hypothetical protein